MDVARSLEHSGRDTGEDDTESDEGTTRARVGSAADGSADVLFGVAVRPTAHHPERVVIKVEVEIVVRRIARVGPIGCPFYKLDRALFGSVSGTLWPVAIAEMP